MRDFLFMSIPFFYNSNFDSSSGSFLLDEETSKHIVQVLRMKEGEDLQLTDGKGHLFTCKIMEVSKRKCDVEIRKAANRNPAERKITIAISLLKNTGRFEWFLEKATEIGVSEIIPLICERTEKEKFRYERMNAICVSAMLQSQQCWLPVLNEPVEFDNLIIRRFDNFKKLIAYCDDGPKQSIPDLHTGTSSHCLVCIGPEGDFTRAEIQSAIKNDFIPISLGETRLRTETAGVVAATLLNHS